MPPAESRTDLTPESIHFTDESCRVILRVACERITTLNQTAVLAAAERLRALDMPNPYMDLCYVAEAIQYLAAPSTQLGHPPTQKRWRIATESEAHS